MNLLDLLAGGIPSYDELNRHYLVFGAEANNALQAATLQRPDAKHRASPVRLTDGRYILCADLLSEIGNNGLMQDGFALLDQTLFAQVDVLPAAAVLPLLPVQEIEALAAA